MFPLTQEYREYRAFLADYEAYQDSKTVTAEEESYWTDMEAMELHAEEDAYYRSFR